MTKLTLQAELAGHTDRVWHLSWSPAAPILASCSTDKSIRLYSFAPAPKPLSLDDDPSPSTSTSAEPAAPTEPAKTYLFSHKSTIPTSHNRTVRSLSFSPTGATLATASFDATVGIWTQVDEAGVEDGDEGGGHPSEGEWEPVDPLEGHESECKSVEWTTGPAEFECLAVLMEHSQDVKSVTWHPTEELLASASYDDTIKLYAADPYDDEWSSIATLTSHTATVWSISFSPCGNYLVSAGDDLVIKIWGRDSLEEKKEVGEAGEAVREEGGRMGPWSRGGVRIGMKEKWEWKLKGEIEGAHLRSVYSVDWGKGGVSKEEGGLGRIVTGGGDGRINVFQIMKPTDPSEGPTHTLLTTLESAHGVSDVNHVAWCRLSPLKAAQRLRVLEGGEGAEEEENEEVEEDPRWKRGEDMFASAGDDGVVKVFVVDQ
ncbi:cytosolic iron-sulfur protein assembly protein 1 [Pseudohyphozyma bogoriensis]|nr:cytosolic iron-sulfur protein assembly protein 1 [Pseudohyphozyma bogoriensis]